MQRWTAIGVLVVALAATSCATRQPIAGQKAGELDRKLAKFAYIEEGKLVTLIVNTLAARDREGLPYVPFEIAVANNGMRKLTLTRESFTLIDANGNRYPAAGPKELLESYEPLDLDRELRELEGIVTNKFSVYRRYASKFSPTRATTTVGIVRDLVSLPRFGYLIDWIYFPMPPGGVLNQRFDLFMDSPDLDNPVFIKFEVK